MWCRKYHKLYENIMRLEVRVAGRHEGVTVPAARGVNLGVCPHVDPVRVRPLHASSAARQCSLR
jgi:hypothetical protein